jgi:hypothetical protein
MAVYILMLLVLPDCVGNSQNRPKMVAGLVRSRFLDWGIPAA